MSPPPDKPRMGLRGQAQEVTLVLENGQTKPVIGTSEPAPDPDGNLAAVQARVRAAAHWGATASPRARAAGGIVQPLPLRSRTILSHQLPQDAQQLLARGLNGDAKVPESGVVATVPLVPPDSAGA